jgi:hypothetical protein
VRSDVLLAAVVALVVVPVLQPLMAQQASRYALTAALADQGTVVIDAYAEYVTVDRAEREGRLYSDKAPGQPVLGVPAYLAYRAFGGAPATQALPLGDLGLWSVNLVSAALPAVALAVLMRRFALRVAPRGATPAALGMALATMLLPFATVLFSHVLSAALGLAAYLLLTRAGGDGRVPGWAIAGSGLLAGLAVTVEFTMGLLVVVLGVTGLVLHRWRSGWYILGGVVPALLLGWYNAVAFGGPLTLSYEYSGFAQHQDGLVGAQLPRLASTMTVLFGERGLLTLTPLVAVGVIGCVALLLSAPRAGVGGAGCPRCRSWPVVWRGPSSVRGRWRPRRRPSVAPRWALRRSPCPWRSSHTSSRWHCATGSAGQRTASGRTPCSPEQPQVVASGCSRRCCSLQRSRRGCWPPTPPNPGCERSGRLGRSDRSHPGWLGQLARSPSTSMTPPAASNSAQVSARSSASVR